VRKLIIASSSVLPVPPGAFEGWAERDRRTAAARRAWSDPALSGPELTRAAAIAQAPADLWRQDAMPGYLARLQRVRFSAEWLRPWRAGTLPRHTTITRLAAWRGWAPPYCCCTADRT
jgi:hypothetical protein